MSFVNPPTDEEEQIEEFDSSDDDGDAVVKEATTDPSPKDPSPQDSVGEVAAVPSASTDDQYAAHCHYEGDVAVYTDPETKFQYVWCNDKNEWVPKPEQPLYKPDDAAGIPGPGESDTDSEDCFGFENGEHTYTNKEGVIFIWDGEKKVWFPRVDDFFLAHYQLSYGVDGSVDKKVVADDSSVSAKDDAGVAESTEGKKEAVKRKGPSEPSWFELPQEQNTKVYVSNLPLDTTEEEFCEVMGKCGLVMRDPVTQKMKVKMYTDTATGALKGDALCTYIRNESVTLALNLIDGSEIRGHKISVQPAKFEMRGDFNPSLKPKKKKNRKDKEKMRKQQEKLFDWRPEKMRGERSKHERVVIVRNLFEPSLFDTEVELILEFQQDLREECTKCGTVKRVVLYDRHPEGVAQITMAEPDEAEAVVLMLNGRWFNKRQLTAEIWDGKTKFKIGETDAETSSRISNWNKFLVTGEEGKEGKPTDDKTDVTSEQTPQLTEDVISSKQNPEVEPILEDPS